MPKICYTKRQFKPDTMALIRLANKVIAEFAAQGFDLTLRQLYYQLVIQNHIPNRQAEYKRLGSIVNDARLAGLIDWEAIVDRTRRLRKLAAWASPADIMESAAESFRVDRWAGQPVRPEVWIEKDALIGVVEPVAETLGVPCMSCRGYTSVSELWGAAMRMRGHLKNRQVPLVIHLGDHDPSGIDMTRDIAERLELLTGKRVPVVRIALNFEQVEEYQPPPNPAKETDSRWASYVLKHGDESWELDALSPTVLAELIETEVAQHRNQPLWESTLAGERKARKLLADASERWPEIVAFLEEKS